MSKEFYMVYLEGGDAPARKHATYDRAEVEATRLAREYRKKAFVLKALVSVESVDIVVNRLGEDDNKSDLPF